MSYEFNCEFFFVGSGDLRKDIYSVVKSELSILFHEKYRVYLDAFSEEEDINIAKYYSEYYQLLNRLSIVLKNKSTDDLKEYIENYSKINGYNTRRSEDVNLFLTVIREIDLLINSFCCDIIDNVEELGVRLSRTNGVFAIIRAYFKKCKDRTFEDFEALLESLYNATYRTMRLKYKENKYGKK